jgi:adenylate cyclase
MDAEFLGARLVLWWAQVAQGAHHDAIADIRVQIDRPGSAPVKKLMLAYAYAAAGDQEEAAGIVSELEPLLVSTDRLALLSTLPLTALGEKDRAFHQLERSFQLREPGLMFLNVAPAFDPLRSDPRFGAMAAKLGLG